MIILRIGGRYIVTLRLTDQAGEFIANGATRSKAIKNVLIKANLI